MTVRSVVIASFLLAAVSMTRQAEADHGMSGDTAAARQQLSESVHRNEGCSSCHGEHGGAETARESCQSCHDQQGADFWRGSHGAALQRGKEQLPTCVSCHGSHAVLRARDPAAATSPGLAPALCGDCHKEPADEFVASVHGRALMDLKSANPPSCPACHGAHAALPINRASVAESCGSCHIEAQLAFGRSVHGTAVARAVLHAPTCTGCHGDHTVQSRANSSSPISKLQVGGETCGRCHGSLRITEMHNLPIEVVKDFRGSFHGMAGALGDKRAANCASCHGYHEIRPSSSPFSRIHPANLGTTCGECHPGATDRFAQAGVHHISSRSGGHRIVDWVRSMYSGMIVAVVGLMLVHNGLDFQRRWRDRRRRIDLPGREAGRKFMRFTLNERVQHWTLAASFITLAYSGFALRFGWQLPWVDGGVQQEVRAGIHRSAALTFMGLAVYHLMYLLLTKRGRDLGRAILPRIRSAADVFCCAAACLRVGPPNVSDWRELIATIKYNSGVTQERPSYGRFTYGEKMEYWALLWGGLVMTATGLALWFETPFLNRFPYWALDLHRTIHLYEAALAVLAIIVWHFYFVIVNPDVFPLNGAMTRGTLSYEEMLREHPLDLKEMLRESPSHLAEERNGDDER